MKIFQAAFLKESVSRSPQYFERGEKNLRLLFKNIEKTHYSDMLFYVKDSIIHKREKAEGEGDGTKRAGPQEKALAL